MYCPACGAEFGSGLRYCKRCGESLLDTSPLAEPTVKIVKTTGAAWAVALATVAITLAGLGITFTTAYELMRPSHWGPVVQPTSDNYIPVAICMIVFGSATIFGIVFLLIKLFSRLMHLPEEAVRQPRRQVTAADAYRATLPPPAHMPSVTEHTTRNFDPMLTGEARRHE